MSAFTDVEKLIMQGAVPPADKITAALDECKALLWQYRDDMRYTPAPDSKARRIQAINKLLGETN